MPADDPRAARRTGNTELIVGGTAVEPGSRQVIRIPITTDLNGAEIAVYVHAIRGKRPGPTLALTTAQHGDEWFGPLLFRKLLPTIDENQIAGTVLAVPVANPVAFGLGQRNTQHESDGPDMNRVWPGTHTWFAELTTKVIAREVLAHTDHLLDFHPSPAFSAMGQVVYGGDFPDESLVERSHKMGVAFGWVNLGRGRLMQVFPGPRSIRAYSGTQLGIDSLVVEIGGTGFGVEQEREWMNANITGVRNVMIHLGMLEGTVKKREKVLLYRRTHRVNPTVAGLLIPVNEPEQMMREVTAGEVLGRIVSPYTHQVLEELTSPCDGWLVFLARSYPIRPGHWAFGVADASESEWITP
jgi:uncharacterized protein